MTTPSLDSATLEMLDQILEEAWQELLVGRGKRADLADEQANRDLMARRLMEAAEDGERDPVRLKQHALAGLLQ